MSKAAGEVTSFNEVDEEEAEGFHEQLHKDQVLDKESNQDEEIISKVAGEISSSNEKVRDSIETPQAGTFNVLEEKNETSIVKVSSLIDPSENLRNLTQLERTPSIGSITAASSLFGPKGEASKEISQIRAPNVELLGEMVLEEVSSSSLRSYVRKNNTIEAEENINTKGSKASVMDHSKTDSPSYGTFKKIIKKKVEKDGEEIKKMVLSTPVRRSSRIATMSP
ncbi:hypothetical protein A4A49_37581 [Nicotiana attenuata]|uniref:Uncharacterized protein n=1 Tax=Nicotiana attenuata TaxID=49451 RepID=A0A1J6ITG0_NICAT|nr:hypothetical protein A4A49_37581 [Nicotiana attenuata]